MQKKKKTSKKNIKKGHDIAKAIMREGGNVKNPYAVGMSAAKKAAAKRKKKKKKD